MTTVFSRILKAPRGIAAELYSGDRMSREEFHQIYEQTPEDFKAELIGGTVYVASPLRIKHATQHPWLSAILLQYQVGTPGVELSDNGTIYLGKDSEPQPDLFLRILPEHGGLTENTEDGYIAGPPELVIEIAHSSKAIDLHDKRADYAKYGVPEYLVYLVAEHKLVWFDLAANEELKPASDGVYRIRQFPGLWIDGKALAAKDFSKLAAVLNDGIATAEHRGFVEKLKKAKRKSK